MFTHAPQKEYTMSTPSRGRMSPAIVRAYADGLRSTPGTWRKMPTTTNDYGTLASQINAVHRPVLPRSEFEAKARADGVYVRYTGPATHDEAGHRLGTDPQPADTDALLLAITSLTQQVADLTDQIADLNRKF